MADEFIEVVKFEATGLDKISTGLKTAATQQKLLTTSTEAYTKALRTSTTAFQTMGRSVNSAEFRKRVRETDELARTQERLTRQIERQTAIARYGKVGGNLAYAANQYGGMASRGLGILGGAATAGFGFGLSGMSGTVPMARLNQQVERLSWEIGNTLTPVVNKFTDILKGASDWMSRRTEGEQNLIGGALTIGAGATAANVASKGLFGMGLGQLGLGVAGGVGSAASGIGSAAGSAAGFLGRFAGPIGAAVAPIFGAFRAKSGAEDLLGEGARYNRGDLSGTEQIGNEYRKKFAGMSEKDRSAAIRTELANQLRAEREGIGAFYGEGGNMLEQMIEIGTGGLFGMSSIGRSGKATEAEARQSVLRAMLSGKQVGTTNHRANPYTGGDFSDVGSGYYAAAAEFGKLGGSGGVNVTGGNGVIDALIPIVQGIADQVKAAAEKQANPLQ